MTVLVDLLSNGKLRKSDGTGERAHGSNCHRHKCVRVSPSLSSLQETRSLVRGLDCTYGPPIQHHVPSHRGGLTSNLFGRTKMAQIGQRVRDNRYRNFCISSDREWPCSEEHVHGFHHFYPDPRERSMEP